MASTTSSRLGLRIEQARWQFGLPDGARRLIASGDFDGRANETLVRWLASDRDLATRLLRWCNTPLYNLSTPYESLDEASRVMEGRELSRLAVLAFVRGLFLPNVQVDTYQRETLWNHSIAVGAVASMISRTCGANDPSLVFVAGTLHDVGICASERLDPDTFRQVIGEVDELSPIHEVEYDRLGWDHTELGKAILEQWGMPEEVQAAARWHHAPEQSLSGPHALTVCCVGVANYLCGRSGWAAIGKPNLAPPTPQVFRKLGIDAGLLTVLWQQLYPALDAVVHLR
ncbi:MAG: HDOD domain-containing protein [Planctomycetota bacterium]